jgi:hypothetical protein
MVFHTSKAGAPKAAACGKNPRAIPAAVTCRWPGVKDRQVRRPAFGRSEAAQETNHKEFCS